MFGLYLPRPVLTGCGSIFAEAIEIAISLRSWSTYAIASTKTSVSGGGGERLGLRMPLRFTC